MKNTFFLLLFLFLTYIVKSQDNDSVNFDTQADNEVKINIEKKDTSSEKKKKFKGHWAGIEIGTNGFLTKNNSLDLPSEYDFLEINNAKSTCISINIAQESIDIIKKKLGIVTGLGFEFNNYYFENNNSLTRNSDGLIIPTYDYRYSTIKSKLKTTYLLVPALIEVQLPVEKNRNKRIFVSGGIIGGIILGSHTKNVYSENGKIEKEKGKGGLNITPFKYGFTGRIGWSTLSIFANYYPIKFFKKNNDPNVYPFSVGLWFGI